MNLYALIKADSILAVQLQKFLSPIRLTTIILFTAFLLVSATASSQSFTYVNKSISLEKVFNEITRQTGYEIFYSDSKFNDSQKIDVNFKNATIKQVMDACLNNRAAYVIQDKTIVIKQIKKPSTDTLVNMKGFRRFINVQGVVLNENNEPLPGATIMVQGTMQATIADSKGLFRLKEVEEDAILIISYIGLQSMQIKAEEDEETINLISQKSGLDEVMVIGYGTTTLRKSTGNVSTITAADIAKQPVSDIFQAMQGRVPGLVVKPTSGYFSGNYNITIRGDNNIPLDGLLPVSDPLYVVDGVPITIGSGDQQGHGVNQNGFLGPAQGQNPLLFINPSDVESISVLKDADATAIYGARGANGVILITTKKAKPGKTQVNVNVFKGYSQQSTTLKLMNTTQYLAMRREAYKNDGINPQDDPGNAYDLLNWDTTKNTDWQKQLLRTAKTMDGQLEFTGGDEKTSFRFNSGYHRETPPFPGDFSERRISSSLNLNHTEFNQKLKTNLILNFSNTNSNLPRVDLTNSIFESPDAPPIYAADGQLNYTGWRPAQFPSAFAALQQPYRANTNNFTANTLISYTIVSGLTINASGGYNLSNQNQQQLIPGSSLNPLGYINRTATFGENNAKTWLFEPNIRCSLPLSNGNLETLLGATYQESLIDGNTITGEGYVNDSQLEDRSAAADYYGAYSNYNDTKLQSFYGRVNYNLVGRYILNLNVRRDGSSRFGPGKRFGNFGSLGAAWIFSEEKLVKNIAPFLSFGKLAASYGLTGGDQIGDYQYLSTYQSGYFPYQGTPVLQLNNAFNPNYNWTVNKKIDISLNLNFLKDRIALTSSWFRNRNGNQLVFSQLPGLTGFNQVINNLPALVQNTGFEFQLNSKNITSKKFNWTTSANIGWTRNKLLAYPGLANSPNALFLTIGQSIARYPLYHYIGMDKQTGYYQFEDKNNDGFYDTSDQNFVNTDPSFTGGIENDIQYANFSLSFFFTFTKQNGFQNAFSGTPGQLEANQPVAVLNRRQKPGDIAKYTGFTTQYRDDISLYQQSDALWGDASYIRLQALSISYNLPSSLFGKTGGPNTRISLQGQNLFTITKYQGSDPSNPSAYPTLPSRRFLTARIEINY